MPESPRPGMEATKRGEQEEGGKSRLGGGGHQIQDSLSAQHSFLLNKHKD